LGNRCYIAGAGEFSGRILPERGDFVIAADAGYLELVSRSITPDLVVGDFDSLGRIPENASIALSPAEKDDTDLMLAVKQGLARGYTTFIIDGVLGGRLDHTMANIQILAYIANKGAQGLLLGRDICMTAISNATVKFISGACGYISVFSAGSVADGVTMDGLKYTLINSTLTYDNPIGVSNEFTGMPATISVKNGVIIIAWTGEPGFLNL